MPAQGIATKLLATAMSDLETYGIDCAIRLRCTAILHCAEGVSERQFALNHHCAAHT